MHIEDASTTDHTHQDHGTHPGGGGHLDLMPADALGTVALATHVAVQSGAWFDPATWGGEVPGAGALVHVPADVSVAYEGASDAGLFMIRVDGELSFSATNGAETKLVVDTILTAPGSSFTVAAGAPDAGNVDIVFAEGSPAAHAPHFTDYSAEDGVLGRYDWDPEQLSLGLVAGGAVTIEGQSVTPWLHLATGVEAGANQLVFDLSDPTQGNWQIGQQIVIGGASWQGRDADGHLISQEEVRSITAVEIVAGQMIVTLDQPLGHDHTGPIDPTTGLELTTAVGNLTRNVTFSSEVADRNADGLADRPTSLGDTPGSDDHLVTERGHIMFAHTDQVSVSDAAFFGLGRTDKSIPVDDFVTDGSLQNHRLYEDTGQLGVYEPGIDMALETPADQIENMRGRYAVHLHQAGIGADSAGAQLEGNVIWGSPGWGLVQHDSAADLTGNLAFDIAGSAFVTETGNETGTWSGNAALGTYGASEPVDNDDSNDFNNDFGSEGVGFWLQGRAIDLIDNLAASSARAGFMYRVNGVDQIDTLTARLGDLADIAYGAESVANADIPIAVFEGNTAIAAYEGLRIVTDPLNAVRKHNDAWSVMRDFTAWEVEESGVSVTYASKYVFENFLILGTGEKLGDEATSGFFFKTSASDITVVDSHVENFQHALTDWVMVGDRQEYRRGFWDPKDPAAYAAVAAYEGYGAHLGIENPAHNLWNINVVDLSFAGITGQTKLRVTDILIDGALYDPLGRFDTTDASSGNDPDMTQALEVTLIDDSAAGGLVALWREDLAAGGAEVLAQHIPLAYGDEVYLGQIHFSDGSLAKRVDYLDYDMGINADIWSGTVLEFAKTDSLGTQIFAYGDFAPTSPGEEIRAVSTNERILFTRDMIDGVLARDGYYTFPGDRDVKFVEMRMLFSDRLSGEAELRKILIALDLAWELPEGVVDNGHYIAGPGQLVAEEYLVFENGVLVVGHGPLRPVLADAATAGSPKVPGDQMVETLDLPQGDGTRPDPVGAGDQFVFFPGEETADDGAGYQNIGPSDDAWI